VSSGEAVFRRIQSGLLIVPRRPNSHIESVTGDVALDFAHSMVRRFDVN
jgi:hypothetical protein